MSRLQGIQMNISRDTQTRAGLNVLQSWVNKEVGQRLHPVK